MHVGPRGLRPTRRTQVKEVRDRVKRIRRERAGVYDYDAMFRTRNRQAPLAEYVGPVEIRMSPGKGRGLFTTADVRAGTLMFCTHAVGHAQLPQLPDPTQHSFGDTMLRPDTCSCVHDLQLKTCGALAGQTLLQIDTLAASHIAGASQTQVLPPKQRRPRQRRRVFTHVRVCRYRFLPCPPCSGAPILACHFFRNRCARRRRRRGPAGPVSHVVVGFRSRRRPWMRRTWWARA